MALAPDQGMMRKLTLRDLPEARLRDQRVLVRVDYNVPIDDGQVGDETRITATFPTLELLRKAGARTILIAHLGRPKGKWAEEFSLRPVAARLSELLGRDVAFVPDIVGAEASAAADALKSGEAILLENVRFLQGEETNDPKLSEAMAGLADAYVNDAFGAAHRAHASTCGVAEIMRKDGRPAVAGLLMERELEFLGKALSDPDHPFVAILGGSKISGKIDVIENLLPRVDHLLIGGAMANTFFRAMGLGTGGSLVEEERLDLARELLERAGPKLVLPVDCVIAGEARPGVRTFTLPRDEVPPEGKIFDVGPKSVATFRDFIDRARTVLWNGPVGMFEIPEFAHGTDGIARAVADATKRGAESITG